MSSPSYSYKQAGVDIDAANEFIQKIKPLVKTTNRPETKSPIGHFAGLFSIPKKYKKPLLVSSTDGVGTKLKLALEWNHVQGLGQDLVAMSANDLICLGAEPLFFLDYFATSKLQVDQAVSIIKGIVQACRDIHCTLLGGETAEMPGIYTGNDFDLAGFIVGVVEQGQVIDGSKIKPGDQIIGMASSGFHSNGFSLVRKIIADRNLSPDEIIAPLSKNLREALLEPTKLYVRQILELKKKFRLKGIAHITGGGLLENIPRIVPKNCRTVIDQKTWSRPTIFQLMKEWGSVEEQEMQRVFNCGIGLMLVVDKKDTSRVLAKLKTMPQDSQEEAKVIGEILPCKKGTHFIEVLE